MFMFMYIYLTQPNIKTLDPVISINNSKAMVRLSTIRNETMGHIRTGYNRPNKLWNHPDPKTILELRRSIQKL